MDILTVNDRPGEYPATSYYVATAPRRTASPSAKGRIACDVCVVGGGYTGLSAALHLARAGFDVIVLEGNRVGWGASGRNGGQVHLGHRLDQDELERLAGREAAHELWRLSQRGVALVKSSIDEHGIDCDWRDGIIHADLRGRDMARSHAYASLMAKDYGCTDIHPLNRAEIAAEIGTGIYFGGLRFERAGHLHPLKFALGLADAAAKAGARLFETSRVLAIEPGKRLRIRTAAAEVEADFALLACGGYHGNLHRGTARHVMPINSFIAATEPLGETCARALIRSNAAVSDSNFVVNYYRFSPDWRLLFGGGESYGFSFPKDIARLVGRRMTAVFPQLAKARIDYAWGGTLGITRTRMPYLEREAGNILSAGGFSGHGIAMATLCGAVAAEALSGQVRAFDLMAAVPQRPFPGGALLRWPILALAMTWFSLRDRL